MMFGVKYVKRCNGLRTIDVIRRVEYSRRSDNSMDTYKVVKSSGESLDDVDNSELGINLNWELLTPQGFRFYLPGSIGPGWWNSSTTAHVKTHFLTIDSNGITSSPIGKKTKYRYNSNVERPILHCIVQECPLLLRKGIQELFSGCLDVSTTNLTVVTITQKSNLKVMKWSKEVETEKLAKYFVLAASNICAKLKLVGYWADFINPFSGQPYFSPQKNNTLYTTDERFRCVGFKIEEKNRCRIISCDNNVKNFVGSLYTTAPSTTEFLKEFINDINEA